jgi:hypothetical protein
MALTPQFAATPRIGAAIISAANALRDGTGTIPNILTAGANGTRVRRIAINATGTTTAGMVRVFLHDGASAHHLLLEVPVSALTPSATVQAFAASFTEAISPDLLPLTIPSGWSIRASTHNAESFRVTCEGADL